MYRITVLRSMVDVISWRYKIPGYIMVLIETHELILLVMSANCVISLIRLLQDCRLRYKVERMLEILDRHMQGQYG
jgi:hypothetical protein